MNLGRVSLACLQIVALTGCSSPLRSRIADAPRDQRVERCDTAMAVLGAIVRPHDEQPLGLEKACVEKYAALNGKIYVDARFVRDGQIESLDEPGCQRDGYVIRFDSKTYAPAPTETVVVLHIDRKDPKMFVFNAVTEDRLWHQAHARNVYSWSPCFSSSGMATLGPHGWNATPKAPPPAP
jgi:hypothetical protein